jgi:hypothetical protein
MAKDLHIFTRILFWAVLLLVFAPITGAMVSHIIADRVHEIQGVIISAFGMLGTLLGWVKGLEQWACSQSKGAPNA